MNVLGSLGYRILLDGAEQSWGLAELIIDESLQELPMYTIDVLSEQAIAPTVMGAKLRFEFGRYNGEDLVGELVARAGIVVGVDLMHRVDRSHFRTRLRVSNKAWLLTLGRRRRIFKKTRASAVMSRIFQEAGLSSTTAASPRTREMVTQFDESDLDFVRRLCEDEGLTLIYAHDSDAKVDVKEISKGTVLPKLGTFVYADPHDVLNVSEPCVQAFSRELRAAPASLAASEWDPKSVALMVSNGQRPAGMIEAFTGVSVNVEVYAAAGGYLPLAADVGTGAKAQYGSVSQVADLCRGRSNIIGFRAGAVFTLEDAGANPIGGEFLLTRVLHRLTLSDSQDGTVPQDFVYENEFECVLASRPFRPARVTPRPQVIAPQVALVKKFPDSEGGNAWGEVGVSFPWQDAATSETAWVRVAQTLAGNEYGSQFLPRVGMEVIVQFIDGDPDRPLVTGVVYNGKAAPPAALPSKHSRSTIRTRSYGGNSPDNEVFFEDADGAEILGLIATKDHSVEVTNDATVHVGHDRTETVDNNETVTVKGNHSHTVEKDRTTFVKGNDKGTVDGNADVTVKGNSKATIYKKLTISADEGIVLQCGDTKIELTPTQATITNAATARLELSPSGAKLEHPSAGGVEIAPAAVTVKSIGGAQVELMGPMVNLN